MTTNKTTYFNLSTYSINRLIKTKLRKPLVLLLGLSVFTCSSVTCHANDIEHLSGQATNNAVDEQIKESSQGKMTEQDKLKSRPYTREDIESYGWLIATVESDKLGLDLKELVLSYTDEDIELIRKLSDLFTGKEKRTKMNKISSKAQNNEVLDPEESLLFQNYNRLLAELKEMLKQKKETFKKKNTEENQKQLKTGQTPKLLTIEDIKMTKEELAVFEHKLRFEHSLNPGTRAYLFSHGFIILESELTGEEENLIKEIDILLKKEFSSDSVLTKEDSEKLWLLTLKLTQPSIVKK